jgi:hypothetical protein
MNNLLNYTALSPPLGSGGKQEENESFMDC